MKTIIEWDKAALLQSPLFSPLNIIIEQMSENHFPNLQDCNVLLEARLPGITTQSGQMVRFVEPAPGRLEFNSQYEPRCYLRGEIQTRNNNWHDLFNAMVWLAFSKAKSVINARHYLALVESTIGVNKLARLNEFKSNVISSQRGPVRDTLTLLDESGVIIPYADTNLADLLCGFQWKKLFWEHREMVKSFMGFYIFGHGLYEKALRPYIGITGQGLLLPVDQAFFGWPLAERIINLDQRLADYIDNPMHCRNPRELFPLPLLGVPGWTPANEHEKFYDNKQYFRDGRRRT